MSSRARTGSRGRGRLSAWVVALVLVMVTDEPASAQEAIDPPAIRGRGDSYRPPEALGIPRASAGLRAGSFLLQRNVALRTSYDDNIDTSNDDRRDDILLSADTGVVLRSKWRRHMLGAGITAGYDRFVQNADESDFRWQVNADGRLDFTRQSSAMAMLRYTRDREDRSSADTLGDSEDAVFHDIGGNLRFSQQGRLVNWSVGLAAERVEFEDAIAADRDRTDLTVDYQAQIDLGPRLTLSLTPQVSRLDYDRTEDVTGFDRDETRYAFVAGLSYQVNERLRTRLGAGYAFEFSDDPAEEDSEGVVLQAGVDYQPTARLSFGIDVIYDQAKTDDLEDSGNSAIETQASLNYALGGSTALRLQATRALRETDVVGANEEIDTGLTASVTQELNSEMRLTLLAGVDRQEFDGINRQDDGLQVSVAYDWAFVEWLNFTLAYRYSQRDSDVADDDFYRNVVSVGLSARF